ncbi:MAG: hypothetical protein AB7L94_31625 [Kofleriaceae bacterium]
MKLLVALAVVLLAGCPRTLSEADRAALQDFRSVDRACLVRAAELLRDESIHLSDSRELVTSIRAELVKPWQDMRARVKLAERRLGDDLSAVLGRYFDERELAWEALAKAIDVESTYTPTRVNHRWQYRESNEAANADAKVIEGKLAALKLPPLPPLAVPPVVDLDPPPAMTTPGAAYFLTGRSVVRLGDSGFQTIATDVDQFDVLPDGTVWGCSLWHVARWDGARTTDWKPDLPIDACTATPDGSLWVLNDRSYDGTSDQIGRFDGTIWKVTSATIGGPSMKADALISDREGRLYVVNRSAGGGSDEVFVLDKTWRRVQIRHASDRLYLNHLFRAGDGSVWATYDVSKDGRSSTGFARLTPAGGDEPIYTADHVQAEQMYPFVDSVGVFTVLDPRRNLLEQATKKRKLPMPVAQRGHDRDTAGPFAIDGAGRIWIDLVDGINVIERGGKRTVYPRGSIPGIVENVKTIVVTGAGPALVAPGPVPTRTIKGQLRAGGKIELSMCAEPWGRECPSGLPVWKTYSDAEGTFTFEDVPRWTFSIQGLAGQSGNKWWRGVDVTCCTKNDTLEPAPFDPEPIY